MDKFLGKIGILVFTLSLVSFAYAASDPKKTGDVLGRDLNIKGLGWIGHVGMWSGGAVIEVLNEEKVIQINKLSNFKERSNYWGARYGVGDEKDLWKVTLAGRLQSSYDPKYTTTAKWREGKWVEKTVWDPNKGKFVSKTVKQAAWFRCDTFVYYSYLKGIGEELVNIATPKNVYYSMPKSR
jgi:hypothetical protein